MLVYISPSLLRKEVGMGKYCIYAHENGCSTYLLFKSWSQRTHLHNRFAQKSFKNSPHQLVYFDIVNPSYTSGPLWLWFFTFFSNNLVHHMRKLLLNSFFIFAKTLAFFFGPNNRLHGPFQEIMAILSKIAIVGYLKAFFGGYS